MKSELGGCVDVRSAKVLHQEFKTEAVRVVREGERSGKSVGQITKQAGLELTASRSSGDCAGTAASLRGGT